MVFFVLKYYLYTYNKCVFKIMNNAKILRITESDLHRIIKECLNSILNEDGATGCDGLMVGMNGTANADESGSIACPFGTVVKQKGYSPKNKSTKMTKVDMNPALKRHNGKSGSISVN